jgi:hypothetical protein
VAGTRRLSSGVIVVADGRAQELRFFDEGGGYIRTAGRKAGELLGRVMVPFRFRPRHIGSDFVLGTWEDEDDIPHVQLYRLIK